MSTGQQAPVLPSRIGRYAIERLLGRGAQGVVLLAQDTELERPVAIKLLRCDPLRPASELVGEARIVSRLQHPNIVTLYDAGRHGQYDYLVFEYIDGVPLDELLRDAGALPVARCVILMSQILAGVAYLHTHGIVHRDLKPGNILVGPSDRPQVMDFGISILSSAAVAAATGGVSGTLRYMSPETLREQAPSPAGDVFSLGCILYEMLTGTHLHAGNDLHAVVRAILAGADVDLVLRGVEADDRIQQVLRRATALSSHARYADAAAMKTELDAYRLPREKSTEDTPAHSTVGFLLRRMGIKRGFSSLSQHVGQLLEITAEGSLASAERLVNILAKDIALSQRVLSQANSAYYGQAEITSLARAVVLMGLGQVRTCVLTALLEEQFEGGLPRLRECLAVSFHSAILAKAMAPSFGVRNRADAYTCGMFHDLGRLLTIHYFAEEYDVILERAARHGRDELTVSRAVLGVAYHELGYAVARQWQLGKNVADAMRPLPRGAVGSVADEAGRLSLCAAYANAVSWTLADHDAGADRAALLAGLDARVAAVAALSPAQREAAYTEAADLTARYAKLLKLESAHSVRLARLTSSPATVAAATDTRMATA